MIDRMEQSFDLNWDEVRHASLSPQTDTDLLVIHDRDDQDSAFLNGETVANAWPGSRLHPTSGLGHRRILRNKDVVAETVGFITAKPAASSLEESLNPVALAS